MGCMGDMWLHYLQHWPCILRWVNKTYALLCQYSVKSESVKMAAKEAHLSIFTFPLNCTRTCFSAVLSVACVTDMWTVGLFTAVVIPEGSWEGERHLLWTGHEFITEVTHDRHPFTLTSVSVVPEKAAVITLTHREQEPFNCEASASESNAH